MKDNIQNAVIESVSIKIERGFILDVWVFCNLQTGGTQGFGGYALYLNKSAAHHNVLSHAGHFICRVMEVAGVEDWDQLKGKSIRVKKEEGWNGRIVGLGNIIKDDWFEPKKDFKGTSNE